MHLDQKNSDSNGYSDEDQGIWFSNTTATTTKLNTIYLKYAPLEDEKKGNTSTIAPKETKTGTVSVSASINNDTVKTYVTYGSGVTIGDKTNTVSLTNETDTTKTDSSVTLSSTTIFSIDLTSVFSYTENYPAKDESKYDTMKSALTEVTATWFTLSAYFSYSNS